MPAAFGPGESRSNTGWEWRFRPWGTAEAPTGGILILETFRKRPERPNSGLRQTKPDLQAAHLVLLRAPRWVLRPAPSAHRLGLGGRRTPCRTLFPEPAMPENLLDELGLMPLHEGNNAHR
jgi:hypothetical protein